MNFSPSIRRVVLATLAATTLSGTTTAQAADLIVSTDGAGTCTTAQPCQLGAALTKAATGDRILLGPGVHAPPGALYDKAGVSGVRILGAPGESRPVLDLSSGTLSLDHGTDLAGVDVVAGADRAVAATGGLLDGLRVQVSGTSSIGIELGDGAVLRNSTVSASGQSSAAVSAMSSAAHPAELRGATVLAVGAEATALRVTPDWPKTTSGVRAVNSIVRGTGTATSVEAIADPSTTATAVLDHVATDITRLRTTGAGATITSQSVLADLPLFVNRANGDLRQTAASPTIDAGTTDLDGDGDTDDADLIAAGLFDLDGSPRRLGMIDLGADEREMPPIVLATAPAYVGEAARATVTVQPRGLLSDVAVEWAFDDRAPVITNTVQASGNEPVTLTIPLGQVPVGAEQIYLKTRVSSSAGTAWGVAQVLDVPVDHVPVPRNEIQDEDPDDNGPEVVVPTPVPTPGTTSSTGRSGSSTAPTPTPKPTLLLPGARPDLMGTASFQARGRFAFRLDCRHTVSCRGQVLVSRIGAVRTDSFKIPPGDERTVQIVLTADQTARVRRAGPRGLRALLEVRSLDDGSTWTAVRFVSSRWR